MPASGPFGMVPVRAIIAAMKKIKADIKAGSFSPVYLLTGPETYLRATYLTMLSDAVVPPEDSMNRGVFDSSASENEIIDLCETLPFFAERRLVCVRESGFFKKTPERLPSYIDRLPAETVLIFSESEVDKRSRLYKAVKEKGYIAEFPVQEEAALKTWSAAYLKKHGKVIRSENASLLLSRTGCDMQHLLLELDKLVNYAGDRAEITREDITELVLPQLEDRIFDMIGAVTAGNSARALHLYHDLLSLKDSPFGILTLIVRQYRTFLIVKDLAGQNVKDIASAAGVRDFVVRRALDAVRPRSRDSLVTALALCEQAEESVKTGRMSDPALSVELLIIELSGQRE